MSYKVLKISDLFPTEEDTSEVYQTLKDFFEKVEEKRENRKKKLKDEIKAYSEKQMSPVFPSK